MYPLQNDGSMFIFHWINHAVVYVGRIKVFWPFKAAVGSHVQEDAAVMAF